MVRFIFDFKGFIVGCLIVFFLIFFGYKAFKTWYAEAGIPQDAVKAVGQAIGNDVKESPLSNAPNKETKTGADSQPNIEESTSSEQSVKKPEGFSTDQAAHELLKQAEKDAE